MHTIITVILLENLQSQYPAMLPLIGISRLLVLYGRLVVGMKPDKSPGR